MLAALGMILLRSPPPSHQKLLEKAIESSELVIDPPDLACRSGELKIVDKIISFIAKDSPTGASKLLANLKKLATSCTRKPSEDISQYIERFVSPTPT